MKEAQEDNCYSCEQGGRARLARMTMEPRNMGKLYAGTSGWAYPQWKPEFYPAKLPAAKFLGYYASRLNSVELNYTFRRFPTEKLLAGWIASTPEGFQFAVKAHQNITHVNRLQDSEECTSRVPA